MFRGIDNPSSQDYTKAPTYDTTLISTYWFSKMKWVTRALKPLVNIAVASALVGLVGLAKHDCL